MEMTGGDRQEQDSIQPNLRKFVEVTSKQIASAHANQVKTALRKEDVAPMDKKLNEMQGQLNEMRGQLQVLVSRIDEIRAWGDNPCDYVTPDRKVTQELTDLTTKVTAAEEDTRDLHEEVNNMEGRVDGLRDSINSHCDELRKEMLDLSAIVGRTEQECLRLDDSVAGFERGLHQIREMAAALSKLDAEILAMKSTNSVLRLDHDLLGEGFAQLREESDAFRDSVREHDLLGLRREHDRMRATLKRVAVDELRVEHDLLSEMVEASLPELVTKTRFLDGGEFQDRFEALADDTKSLLGRVNGLSSLPGKLQDLENRLSTMKHEDLQFRASENRKTNGMFMTIGRLEKLMGGDDFVDRMRKVITMAAELVEVTQAGMTRSDKRTAQGKYALDANKQARRLLHFANTMELKDLAEFCDDPVGDRITPVHKRPKRKRRCRL
jgi:predicted  nucleic acid-binding Zn-ribbon protein